MAAIQYKISFVPDSNYGCITKKTTNRKEAYAIYREMKEQIGAIRPGELCIFEVLDNGTERYLCRFKTGKDRNAKLMIQDIKKMAKKLNKVYNIDHLIKKESEYSKMQSNLLHGIELMDMSKVDSYEFAKYIVEKQELVTHLRRQYKADLHDAKALENDMRNLLRLINKIQGDIANLRQHRYVTDSNKPNEAQTLYLESLGIDVGAYCHNADPQEILPLGKLVKPINKEAGDK